MAKTMAERQIMQPHSAMAIETFYTFVL